MVYNRSLLRIFVVLLAIGFVGALILAWYHGEKGRQRVSGPELVMMAALLVIAGTAVSFLRRGEKTAVLEPGRPEPEAVIPPAGVPEQGSIAVLPFVNMSGNDADEYFSDGMTEELISALAKVDGLRVAARTSAFAFKGRNVDVREIGQRLNVQSVLQGSVRKAGNRLRITAQLVKVADGYHLWSETYERELKDVFAVQDEISRAIVSALRIRLAGTDRAPLVTPETGDPEVYSLYLKGRYFWNKRTEPGLGEAITLFEEAIRRDPAYARAYAGLADAYVILTAFGFAPPKDAMPRARSAARKALEFDERLAEAHTSLAYVKMWYDRDWAGAEKEFRRAIDLNPGYPTAHHWYSLLLVALGRFEEGIAEIRRAQELDPLSLNIASVAGTRLHFARQYERALDAYRSALQLDPNWAFARMWLAILLTHFGRFEEAIPELRRAVELSPTSTIMQAALAYGYARSGRREEAFEIVRELEVPSAASYVPPYWLAVAYTGLGEADRALGWLERGYRERDGWLLNVKVDPAFDPLRADRRFVRFLSKLRFPE